jgi:hypothetical protein
MKSYQLIGTNHNPQSVEQINQVVTRLRSLGLVIINAKPGRTPSIHVQPTAATRRLESVYTGQGWEDGKMYKSYAAVIDGVKIVWHKPMRAPEASNVIKWPGQGYRRAGRKCMA